ncbi:hypothetical protein KAW96_11740, partial [candidate division WOR-3 bacterium]|nr:hypothetical protein [candidate division WOR-3 bacterium]
ILTYQSGLNGRITHPVQLAMHPSTQPLLSRLDTPLKRGIHTRHKSPIIRGDDIVPRNNKKVEKKALSEVALGVAGLALRYMRKISLSIPFRETSFATPFIGEY